MTKPKNITQALSYISGVFHQRDTGYVSPIIEIDPYKGIRRSIKQSKKAAKASAREVRSYNVSVNASAPPKKKRGYYEGKEIKQGKIVKIYSKKSRVVKKVEGAESILLERDGKKVKGHLFAKKMIIQATLDGKKKLITLHKARSFQGITDTEHMIYSLDKATDPDTMRYSMMYAQMSSEERRIVQGRMEQINWTDFWKDTDKYDPQKAGLNMDADPMLQYIFDGFIAPEIEGEELSAISNWKYIK